MSTLISTIASLRVVALPNFINIDRSTTLNTSCLGGCIDVLLGLSFLVFVICKSLKEEEIGGASFVSETRSGSKGHGT